MKPYVCESCGGTFTSDVSDADAVAEAEALFGASDEPVIVCDDCFYRLCPQFKTGEPS